MLKLHSKLSYILIPIVINVVDSFLLDDPKVDCPHPATNCLDNTFNRVFENLGCLGCQSGCQPGYTMTANPRYFVKGNNTAGFDNFQGVKVPRTRNVSEPQWLCVAGSSCPFGYYSSKLSLIDSCAYCGDGCWTCQSYDNCDTCLLGYWVTHSTVAAGVNQSTCVNSGILCPLPADGWHCKHQVYARSVVGCSGCVMCEDGYLPTSNPRYRRTAQNVTGNYKFMGLQISGTVEISQARYTCVKGSTCPLGWHAITRSGLVFCEAVRPPSGSHIRDIRTPAPGKGHRADSTVVG